MPLATARLFLTLALRIDELAKNQIGRLKKVFALEKTIFLISSTGALAAFISTTTFGTDRLPPPENPHSLLTIKRSGPYSL